MPKYAQFDPTKGPPYPVIGWYDTDIFTYVTLPDPSVLQIISDDDWNSRLASPYMGVNTDGSLVAITAPVPTLTLGQQAIAAISVGLTIALDGTIELDPTIFPCDPDTQSKITAVVTAVNTTGNFPGGALSYPMRDSNGAWHLFTINQYLVVAGAIASYVSSLYLIADGNPFGAVSLPASAISLEV